MNTIPVNLTPQQIRIIHNLLQRDDSENAEVVVLRLKFLDLVQQVRGL